jgi:hypothetical protein
MMEYLDAPVPFVCGVAELPTDKEYIKQLEAEKIVINIDTNSISLPKSLRMQGLPESKRLYL